MPRLALTFDDGPSPHTEVIADLIAEHGGVGTFFVLGDKIPGEEPLLRRMVAAGHELGNHTYSHPHCGRLEEGALREELARAQQVITEASGRAPVLVRPPYGEDAERVEVVGAHDGPRVHPVGRRPDRLARAEGRADRAARARRRPRRRDRRLP